MTTSQGQDAIAILGCGRVGSSLALALHGAGWNIAQLSSFRTGSALELAGHIDGAEASTGAQAAVDASTIVLLTVPDDAIESVASSLDWSGHHRVLHCCGLHGLDVLASARDSGAAVGSLHPLMAITDPQQGAASLRGCTFAIEGEGAVHDMLTSMVESLGGHPVTIAPEHRALYHASAMLVGGYLSALGAEAAGLWTVMGLDPADGLAALAPMMEQVARNLKEQGVPGALAGSVQRGDVGTVEAHLEALSSGGSTSQALELYMALARVSLEQARRHQSIDQEQIDQIDGLLT